VRPTRTNAHRPPRRPQLAAPPSHKAQHQQSDPPKNSHPLSCSPCDHTLQPQKNSKRVFPSPRKFQLHTCPLMTSEMALATAQRRKNKLATLRVHHLEIMTQPALGGAPCSGPSVESKASPEALLATVSGLCFPRCIPQKVRSQKKRPPRDLPHKEPPQCLRPQPLIPGRDSGRRPAALGRRPDPIPPAVSLSPVRAPKNTYPYRLHNTIVQVLSTLSTRSMCSSSF